MKTKVNILNLSSTVMLMTTLSHRRKQIANLTTDIKNLVEM